ncbi:methylenetetrahydrofolate dehydrogenase [Penicillium atrosanguineum]|nr:methylenetetrahydrofolate dehydrogenase [Penicillium atrosanguineum]
MHVQLSDKVRKFSKRLCLAGVLASDDAGSRQYADWTRETCQAIGVDFCLVCLSPRNVATYIKALNTNPCIDGIIVYYPIFGDSRDDDVKILVNHGKDVEALNCRPTLQFPEVTDGPGQPCLAPTLVPCTARAIESILHMIGIYDQSVPTKQQLGGWEVCIINRSDVVGLPLARLLAGQGARVYSVDVAGVQLFQLQSSSSGVDEIQSLATEWTLQDAVKMSGVIISAVPHPAFKVDTEWLQSGAICINVSSFKNFKSDVLEIASKFMPRVGKLTIVALLSNLLLCADKH